MLWRGNKISAVFDFYIPLFQIVVINETKENNKETGSNKLKLNQIMLHNTEQLRFMHDMYQEKIKPCLIQIVLSLSQHFFMIFSRSPWPGGVGCALNPSLSRAVKP